jgi:hypothetical protein
MDIVVSAEVFTETVVRGRIGGMLDGERERDGMPVGRRGTGSVFKRVLCVNVRGRGVGLPLEARGDRQKDR